jgi:Tol biopolymer transport system component
VVAALVVLLAFAIGYAVVSQLRRPAATAEVREEPAMRDEAGAQHESALTRAMSRAAGAVFSPSFTRGGGTLFFHTGRNADASSALKAVDLRGGKPHVTTIIDDGARNYHVQPSPAGNLIAYDSDRDGERGVYLANRDGSGIRRVSGSGFAAVPTWSADGRRLAFVRAEPEHPRVWNLWLLSIDTGDSRRLTRFRYGQTWGASWFPDGHRISYSHEDRLYIRDLATGVERALESPIKGRQVRTPAVSPDGSRVVFQVVRSGAWLLDVEQGTMVLVLEDPTAEEFAWAPNGRVAFHSRRDGQWGIWLMTPA